MGVNLKNYDKAQLDEFLSNIRSSYDELQKKKLSLNLTRGKPSAEQLDYSTELASLPGERYLADDGTDCRNYGGLTGIMDIRTIYAELLNTDPQLVWAQDASSLNIQFDVIAYAYLFGTPDSPRPWKDEKKVTWLCPVPGYDRHFTITEHFGFELVAVPMTDEGPDMNAVKALVADDPTVKGMWSVPVFGNPTGITYSRAVCEELAAMPTAAPDFRILWDNAYAVHILDAEKKDFPAIHDVIGMAAQAGNPNRFVVFASTSKVTFPGSGVSFVASSAENLDWYASHAAARGIGPNKMNQLAHAMFFGGSADGVRRHMLKHARSLGPKFAAVLDILDNRLGEYGVATWTKPEGGYFISLDVVDGTASRVVELARDAGISLTQAGSSFPHHEDPNDRNIRLAPSFPPLEDLKEAMNGVATCVLLAAAEFYAQHATAHS